MDAQTSYAIGTCFGCQICLKCSQSDACLCDKTQKPEIYKVERQKKKRKAYSREFSPTDLSNNSTQYKYLQLKKKQFNYNIDFSNKFSIYFCTKCHSQFCRESKKSTHKKNSLPSKVSPRLTRQKKLTSPLSPFKTSPTLSPKISTPPILSPKILTSPVLSPSKISTSPVLSPLKTSTPSSLKKSTSIFVVTDDENDESYISVKFKLSIKKADNSMLPQRWLNMELTSFFEFTYNIEKQVKKMLNLTKVNKKDYILSYQALNSKGVGTQLFDNNDWKEFLYDVKEFVKEKKTLLLTVIMNNNKYKSENSKKKRDLTRYI
jgi:hypothetical protein